MPNPDLAWDAMVEVCGYQTPVTETERGRINSALKELRAIYPNSTMYAVAVDIRTRAAVYVEKWVGMEVTPQAIVGNWSRLDPAAQPEAKAKREIVARTEKEPVEVECPTCGGQRMVLYQIRSDGSEEYAPCPDCHPDHMAAGFWRHYALKPGESMRYNPPEPAKVRAAMLRLLEPDRG